VQGPSRVRALSARLTHPPLAAVRGTVRAHEDGQHLAMTESVGRRPHRSARPPQATLLLGPEPCAIQPQPQQTRISNQATSHPVAITPKVLDPCAQWRMGHALQVERGIACCRTDSSRWPRASASSTMTGVTWRWWRIHVDRRGSSSDVKERGVATAPRGCAGRWRTRRGRRGASRRARDHCVLVDLLKSPLVLGHDEVAPASGWVGPWCPLKEEVPSVDGAHPRPCRALGRSPNDVQRGDGDGQRALRGQPGGEPVDAYAVLLLLVFV
jgi:hypothetical protein